MSAFPITLSLHDTRKIVAAGMARQRLEDLKKSWCSALVYSYNARTRTHATVMPFEEQGNCDNLLNILTKARDSAELLGNLFALAQVPKDLPEYDEILKRKSGIENALTELTRFHTPLAASGFRGNAVLEFYTHIESYLACRSDW